MKVFKQPQLNARFVAVWRRSVEKQWGVGPGLFINNRARKKCIPNDVWRILGGSGSILAAGGN